jgi:hypothetical protein
VGLISTKEAADRLGVPRATIDDWVERGLLGRSIRPAPQAVPGEAVGPGQNEACVDEDQLLDIAESLGWLQVGTDRWDGPEEG